MLRSYKRRKLGRNGTNINDAARSSHDDIKIGSRSESEDDEFEDDLNMLREFSLVPMTTQSGLLELHPLMQFCTQFWVSSFDNLRKWRRMFLQVMSKEYTGRRV
ncbi:kinesin light [Colletotrichum higginsianum]|nr:kinesin light [Colletotrichum higginsianum]